MQNKPYLTKENKIVALRSRLLSYFLDCARLEKSFVKTRVKLQFSAKITAHSYLPEPTMQWFCHTFKQLDTATLYNMLRLRIDVFVVEQTCYYPDLDGLDCFDDTLHVYARNDSGIVGYLRCLAPGRVYSEESAIGRVVIAPQARGLKLGHELIKQGIVGCEKSWPNHKIHISAQAHLQKYYQQHGFQTVTDMYLEDDIPHVGMIRTRN